MNGVSIPRRLGCPFVALVLACLAVCAASSSSSAQPVVPRQLHPWGRCGIDSWKRVRVLTETLDENGKVVSASTTETTTSLIDLTDEVAVLWAEVTVEVAGKRFTAQPQIIKQGYFGEVEGQTLAVKQLEDGSVSINASKLPAKVREITITGNASRRISKVWYSENSAPYILRRETVSTDPAGQTTNFETNVDVVGRNLPYKVIADTKTASLVRTIHKNAKGTVVTIEVRCVDVPGGVVAHMSKQTDIKGRVVRRSRLELLDYGVGDAGVESARNSRWWIRRKKWREALNP